MICGFDNFACNRSLKNSGELKKDLQMILMICGLERFAGENVFEYFPDIADLRLR